jgi:DNA modification methylase
MHRKNLRNKQNKAAGKKGTTPKNDDKTSAFCLRCGAWRGELGLEPTSELYLKHLCSFFDEIKRVLKNTGSAWINLGDSFGGSGEREYFISEGCSCGAGFRPGIFLDPFMGSGTTALVAKKLGRDFIGIDVSDKYVDMTERRLANLSVRKDKKCTAKE